MNSKIIAECPLTNFLSIESIYKFSFDLMYKILGQGQHTYFYNILNSLLPHKDYDRQNWLDFNFPFYLLKRCLFSFLFNGI